jgi:hypothetical protein
VGGLIGAAEKPRELILGRFGDGDRLRIAGRTTRLSPTASAQLAALLHPATDHPWPERLPPHPYGESAPPTRASRPTWSSSCPSTSPWTDHAGGARCGFVRVRGELNADDLAGDASGRGPISRAR